MGFNFWHWGFYSGSHWRWSMCIVQNTHLLAEGEQACWMYRSCQPSHAGTAQDVRGQDPRLYLGSPPTGLPQRALKLDTAHSGLTRLATSVWFSFWSCDQLYVLVDVKEQSFKKKQNFPWWSCGWNMSPHALTPLCLEAGLGFVGTAFVWLIADTCVSLAQLTEQE